MTVAEEVSASDVALTKRKSKLGCIAFPDQVHLGSSGASRIRWLRAVPIKSAAENGDSAGLVFDPPVLLLDEPLGAVDKNLPEHLRNEIKTLHKEVGKTMVYLTHDQDEALATVSS